MAEISPIDEVNEYGEQKSAMLLTDKEWEDLASLLRFALAQHGVVTAERAIANRILEACDE